MIFLCTYMMTVINLFEVSVEIHMNVVDNYFCNFKYVF